MGLLVVPVLQAVFDVAQEAVGGEQGFDVFRRHDAQLGKFHQRFLRAFQLQSAHLSAAYHLENLGDKFDLADTARAEFDVVHHAFFADFAADLAVQVAHRLIRAVIQIFAEHEGAHQRFDVVRIRRNHAAFAPRIAFPFAPLRNQVLLQRGFAQYQRARIAVRPQPHIDAEHLPVGGNVVQQRNQFLPDFGEKFLITAFAPAVGVARFGIDENQIDVGRHVQLIAARLAHRHHAQMLRRFGITSDRRAVHVPIIGVGEIQRGIDGKIGKQRNRAGYFVQIADAVYIAHDNLRHHITAQLAQLPRQFFIVFFRADLVPIGKGLEIRFGQHLVQHGQENFGLEFAVVELAGKEQGMAAGGVEAVVGHFGFRLEG